MTSHVTQSVTSQVNSCKRI